VTLLPMFPLGSVLFPHMPLPLHIFEERYRRLVADCLGSAEREEPPEFGVVLIERGREVGGGEDRFGVGTVAQITEVGRHDDGRYSILAVGTRRVAVQAWLPDDPYPMAETEDLPAIAVDGSEHLALLARADLEVRRCLGLAADLDEATWPPDVALDADPTAAAWQLCAIAPLGPLDQLALLGAASTADLLTRLAAMSEEQAGMFAFRLGSG
jgi:Lon protease-like protein